VFSNVSVEYTAPIFRLTKSGSCGCRSGGWDWNLLLMLKSWRKSGQSELWDIKKNSHRICSIRLNLNYITFRDHIRVNFW
jgi:hypothetical protein